MLAQVTAGGNFTETRMQPEEGIDYSAPEHLKIAVDESGLSGRDVGHDKWHNEFGVLSDSRSVDFMSYHRAVFENLREDPEVAKELSTLIPPPDAQGKLTPPVSATSDDPAVQQWLNESVMDLETDMHYGTEEMPMTVGQAMETLSLAPTDPKFQDFVSKFSDAESFTSFLIQNFHSMHSLFPNGAPDVDINDPATNMRHKDFWRLHGWLDQVYGSYLQSPSGEDFFKTIDPETGISEYQSRMNLQHQYLDDPQGVLDRLRAERGDVSPLSGRGISALPPIPSRDTAASNQTASHSLH